MGATSGVQFLPFKELELLFQQFIQAGYSIHAPQVVDGAILYSETESIDMLPRGVVDHQQPGHYRLTETGGSRYFSWSSALQGVKAALFPPSEVLWSAEQQAGGELDFTQVLAPQQAVALFGVRACDLAAIKLMDRHFLRSGAEDPWYQQRRANLLLITVSCSSASGSCLCASTATGPESESGFDLRLDELDTGFLIRSGSEQGEILQAQLGLKEAKPEQLAKADEQLHTVATQQQRAIATNDFRCHFTGQEESPVWQQIADRCLGCGNCTAVCPTCFCHREEEVPSLDLQGSLHQRVWDSCFSGEHSQLHGVPVRTGRRERYRQWMMHKLAGWHDQFGESGCVGCGRCITWCPTGVDLLEESARFVRDQLRDQS